MTNNNTVRDECREAFEKWAVDEYLPCYLTRHQGNSDTYAQPNIHNAWQGFKAALNTRTPQPNPLAFLDRLETAEILAKEFFFAWSGNIDNWNNLHETRKPDWINAATRAINAIKRLASVEVNTTEG